MKIQHRPASLVNPAGAAQTDAAQKPSTSTAPQNPVDAFERVVQSLLQAPLALLKTGSEAGLAEFLQSGPFDQQQMLKDLTSLAQTMGSLSPMKAGMGGASSSAQRWQAAPTASLPDITLAQGQVGDRQQTSVGDSGTLQTVFGQMHGQTGARGSVDRHAQGRVSLGRRGLQAKGNARFGANGTVEARGGINNALMNAQGGVGATGDIGAHAKGQMTLNATDGLRAQGHAGANVSGYAHLDGSLRSALLNADVQGRAGGHLGANVHGSVVANAQDGFRLKAGADAEAMVRAEMKGQFQTLGLNVGGERLDVNGNVHAYAEAGAYARADVDVAASIQPPRLGLDAKAGAFAGAKAGVVGKIGLGEFVSVTGKAEAWAGAGAEAGLIAGFDKGKLRLGFHAGAAVKAGAGTEWSVEIDVAKMLKSFAGGTLQIAGRSLEFALDPQKAIEHTIQDVLGTVLGKDAAKSIPLGPMLPGLSPLGLLGPGLSDKALQESPVNQALDSILKQSMSHLPISLV
jgi:hypothetical protein